MRPAGPRPLAPLWARLVLCAAGFAAGLPLLITTAGRSLLLAPAILAALGALLGLADALSRPRLALRAPTLFGAYGAASAIAVLLPPSLWSGGAASGTDIPALGWAAVLALGLAGGTRWCDRLERPPQGVWWAVEFASAGLATAIAGAMLLAGLGGAWLAAVQSGTVDGPIAQALAGAMAGAALVALDDWKWPRRQR